MIERAIIVLSSPAGLGIALIALCAISMTIRATTVGGSLLGVVDNASSGLGFVFILLLAATFFDIATTCRILLQNNLLQFEFLVITFAGVWHMAARFIRTLDD